MATLTIEIPDELMEQLSPFRDQLPELLRRGLQPLALPAQVYRYILDFLASQPTPEQVASFRPTPEMQDRLRELLSRERCRHRVGRLDNLCPLSTVTSAHLFQDFAQWWYR